MKFNIFSAIAIIFAAVLCPSSTSALLRERKFRNEENSVMVDSEKLVKAKLQRLEVSNEQKEYNKKLVRNFYQEVFGDKNVEAIDKYISAEVYIQHNPTIGDGKEAFKKGATEWFKNAPKEVIDIQRITAEGDLVWVHTKANNEGKLSSCIDIFRVFRGRIIEHWDVMQDVPEKSNNPHPMF